MDGVLIVNKAKGMTSHDVINKIRRLYGTKQVGHTGTLDPTAEGVLCVLIGRAVKASEYAVEHDKSYIAGLKLGVTTDTGDVTGNVLTTSDTLPDEGAVFEAVSSFKGEISQIPPMYSALKVNGNKLCDLARKGITVEREARTVNIYGISVKSADAQRGEYSLFVSCSRGTYIRTLCEDIGQKLGVGATMSSLVRTESGGFRIEESYTLEDIESMTPEKREAILIDTEKLFSCLEIIRLPDFFARLALVGNEVYLKKIGLSLPEGTRVRLYDSEFFSLGEVREYPDGLAIKPIKKFRL